MAVKKGSGKAYQYAREDHERRKEIRQEKKEEERLLREGAAGPGVNLHSTDLSVEARSGLRRIWPCMVTEEDLARFSADRKPEEKMETAVEQEEKAVRRPEETGGAESGSGHSPSRSRPSYMRKRKSRVRIRQMYSAGISPWPERSRKKETVPFDEDLSLSRPHRDEDVFLSRSSRDFEDMDVFPGGGRPSMEQTAAQAASEAIPEAETFTEPWEEPERPWQSLERQRMLRQSRRTTATGWMRIMTGTGTSRMRKRIPDRRAGVPGRAGYRALCGDRGLLGACIHSAAL